MMPRQVIHILFEVVLIAGLLPGVSLGQSNPPDTVSKGKFILHKFQQPIGKEIYSIVIHNDSIKLKSDFKFNDRGQDVPLQTTLVTSKAGIPAYFKIKGKTSRFSEVDSEVRITTSDSAIIRVDKT